MSWLFGPVFVVITSLQQEYIISNGCIRKRMGEEVEKTPQIHYGLCEDEHHAGGWLGLFRVTLRRCSYARLSAQLLGGRYTAHLIRPEGTFSAATIHWSAARSILSKAKVVGGSFGEEGRGRPSGCRMRQSAHRTAPLTRPRESLATATSTRDLDSARETETHFFDFDLTPLCSSSGVTVSRLYPRCRQKANACGGAAGLG